MLSGDQWVVAFVDDDGRLWTRRFNKDGSSAVGRLERRANTTSIGDQANPKGAVSSTSDAMVVYESPIFGETGTEILGRVFDNTGNEAKAEFRVNSYLDGDQGAPAIAGGPDRFVVVWDSVGQDGGSDGIFAQRYAGNGSAVGAEFQVNVTTAGAQRQPSVAMADDGRFLVTWTGQVTGTSKSDVFGRLFAADGTPATGELAVNTTTADYQQRPVATKIPGNGGFVVGWESNDADPNLGFEVYLRKFDAAGAALTSEIRANSTTGFDQANVALSVAPNAQGLVACWDSWSQDVADSWGVACRFFNMAALNSVGPDFVPYLVPDESQLGPTVSHVADGSVLVGWSSCGLDGDGMGVQYQRFTSTGIADGPRVQANRTWAGGQSKLFIAPFALGHFMVGWQSDGQDGDGAGVYFRVMPPP